jgi:hypothetical protein
VNRKQLWLPTRGRDGKVVGVAVRKVSADGRVLTITDDGTTRKGLAGTGVRAGVTWRLGYAQSDLVLRIRKKRSCITDPAPIDERSFGVVAEQKKGPARFELARPRLTPCLQKE